MKTPEDEAFDDIARKQGAWGGGYPAKKAMAADKLQEDLLNYGTSWEKDGERIDPMSVYKEPVTEREALKLALEALNDMACWKEGKEVDMGFDEPYAADTSRKAIAAIKAALAQPAQEPVVQPAPGYCKNCKDYTIEEPLPPQPAQEPTT